MTPSLATLIATDPPTSLGELIAREAAAVQAASSVRCANPECETGEKVKFGDGRGRPKIYCCESCRRSADHTRSRLQQDLANLDELAASLEGSARERRTVEGLIARRRWLLRSYRE